MGCEVTAITTSPGKADALRSAGAAHVVISTDEESMKAHAKSLDLILNTISANHDAMQYQKLLATDGTRECYTPVAQCKW
jgi:alcohol dehydrogenase (NADP+)